MSARWHRQLLGEDLVSWKRLPPVRDTPILPCRDRRDGKTYIFLHSTTFRPCCRNTLHVIIASSKTNGIDGKRLTGRFVKLTRDVHDRPPMSGVHARVGAASEHGREEVPVLFPLWAPSSGRLLEDAVVAQPDYMRKNYSSYNKKYTY